jgi:predicted DNA-binding transcriptional regulator YafY
MTRIKELSLTGNEFIRKTFDSTRVFADDNNHPAIHIKMRFSQLAYHRVLDYFETNQLQFQPDGSIIVEVDYPEDEWVYSLLLGFGAYVEILEPTHLRHVVYQRAKEIVDKYNQHTDL